MTDTHVFPQPTGVAVDNGRIQAQINAGGLSKRELFAAMAMQGMLSRSEKWDAAQVMAVEFVNIADALIAALEGGS